MARFRRLVVLMVLATASAAWAQPANDDCANATVIGALQPIVLLLFGIRALESDSRCALSCEIDSLAASRSSIS